MYGNVKEVHIIIIILYFLIFINYVNFERSEMLPDCYWMATVKCYPIVTMATVPATHSELTDNDHFHCNFQIFLTGEL